jgi:hypothetical protein
MPGNLVIGKDVVLIGQEVVAEELGVTSQAISNWYKRELEGLPAPVLIQYQPGKKPLKVWRMSQLGTWRKWHKTHLADQGQHIPARNMQRARRAKTGTGWI